MYLFRDSIAVYAKEKLTANMFIPEDRDQFNPGIGIGEKFPAIRAWYRQTEKLDLQEFMGSQGLIVFMNRSVDWWPYCQKQLVKLQEHQAEFEQTGLKVIAITYDAPQKQQPFIDRFAIQFPLLSDIEATTVKNLGILNEDYAEGHSAYGIPYPGIFILDTDKKIVGKVFIAGYKQRLESSAILKYAKKVLGLPDS